MIATPMNSRPFPSGVRPTCVPDHVSWNIPHFSVTEIHEKKTKYCFVTVVWNEGERLKNQLVRMKEYARLADIIVADGDSDDGSTNIDFLRENNVRTLLVTQERGLCTATRMAIAYAMEQGYEGIVTVDGNGKDDVRALPTFLEHLEMGYDLVQGSRFMPGGIHSNTPLERYMGIRLVVNPIISLSSGMHYTDVTNAFRACSMRYLTDPRLQPLRTIFVRFNLQFYLNRQAPRLGMKCIEIPVKRIYPSDGSVPTKITTLRTKLLLMKELLMTISGRYDT